MADNVSLAFANTAEWHAGPSPEERLTSYTGAVEWARDQGILDEDQARHLKARAQAHPSQEAEAMRRIIALREAIYHLFSAVAHRRPPEPADVQTLNAELAGALPHLQLVVTDGGEAAGDPAATRSRATGLPGFHWAWTGLGEHLVSFLWPVARDATELLTSHRLVQVRECAGDPCGWLFIDSSKNASRRWCDMADCGNRAKAQRYRARKKATPQNAGAGDP